MLLIKSYIFWNITLCSTLKNSIDVSEELSASIFMVEEAEQITRMKSNGFLIIWQTYSSGMSVEEDGTVRYFSFI